MDLTTVIEVLEEVEFRYPEDPWCSYTIPAGLTLSMGEAWCIRGVSGSGKSTLMTLLATLRRLGRGRVRYRFAGGDVVEVAPQSWDAMVGPALWRRIGFAFQRPELIRALSVADNLRLALDNGELVQPDLFNADEWRSIAASRVWEVSGGQVQRLGLLRAFGRGQDLIFLDEPTNNLDRRNRQVVAEFVQAHRGSRALVVVSHDDDFIRTLSVDRRLDIGEAPAPGGGIRRVLDSAPSRRAKSPGAPRRLRAAELAQDAPAVDPGIS